MFPLSHLIHIVYDGARPHLRGMMPEEYVNRFQVHLLPPYSPFFNPTEQTHSCFKAHVKQQLASPVIQAEIMDAPNLRVQQHLTQIEWRARILERVGHAAIHEI